jgi:hypothetical protein
MLVKQAKSTSAADISAPDTGIILSRHRLMFPEILPTIGQGY